MNTIIDKKTKIQYIVNVFETGSIKGDYGNISIYNDGPSNEKQVTYGRSQTTEYGNLVDLIKLYVARNGKYSDFFTPYIAKIGKTPLCRDMDFVTRLKQAGSDPIMVAAQDDFFDTHYWEPALKFCTKNGFIKPLSGLVIYDSFIHSGSILSFLRNKFKENVPVAGGNEDNWITSYLQARKFWLENHTTPILRKTVYRVNNMITAKDQGNWELNSPFIANGVIVS